MNEEKLEQFMGQIAGDAGAALGWQLAYMGDRLGIWKAMAGRGPLTAAQVAAAAGTNERLTLEWLSAQAAGGYVTYDAASNTFTLPDEQAMVLADETSPVFLQGFIQAVASVGRDIDKAVDAMRTGRGFGWGDHHADLFEGTERFFKPAYAAHLIDEWLPQVEGALQKLTAGARVADVGCGHGSSTILMAKAYPNSTFVGYDFHPESIERARKAAADEGVADRVAFEVARAEQLPAGNFDLIGYFDCLHDMSDPQGAVTAAKRALAPGGIVFLVEPYAADTLADNLNPVGRIYYGASTVVCTPSSLSEGGPGLGAQAGEARVRALFDAAGFGTFRRATETPFNIVYQARI